MNSRTLQNTAHQGAVSTLSLRTKRLHVQEVQHG
jgi:hypothetical protein